MMLFGSSSKATGSYGSSVVVVLFFNSNYVYTSNYAKTKISDNASN